MKQLRIILLLFFIITLLYVPQIYGQDAETEETSSQEVKIVNPYDLFKQGKYIEAITEANKQISSNRNNINAHVVLGWAYINTRQWKKALDVSTQAEKIFPNDVRIIETKGEAYYQLREDEKALEYFSRYLTLSPTGSLRSWVYYYVGVIYIRQNKLNKANIALSTALSLERDKQQWWLDLGSVYEKQNKIESAKEVYRTVLSINSSNSTAKQKLQQFNQE